VKKAGEWLKPLTFLGLSYDGVRKELSAFTRNGSRLVMDKTDILDYINMRDLKADVDCNYHERMRGGGHQGVCSKDRGDKIDCPCPTMCSMGLGARMQAQKDSENLVIGGKTWKEVVSSKIFGFIQARLYSGE